MNHFVSPITLPGGKMFRCHRSTLFIAIALIPILLLAIVAVSSKADDLKTAGAARQAPKPLYRDPVHDGAADPSLIWNRAERKWMMFYTNRRADVPSPTPKDVAWV